MGKSINKKIQRMQEQIARRTGQDPKINPLTAGWTFETWWEKVILIILMSAGIWRIFTWVF